MVWGQWGIGGASVCVGDSSIRWIETDGIAAVVPNLATGEVSISRLREAAIVPERKILVSKTSRNRP